MGYNVELVASPPRPVNWADLSTAAEQTGWQVDAAAEDISLVQDGQLLARLQVSKGEAWVKSPDDAVLTALIALADKAGLRARGDDFESYRSLDDWYIHPDDAAFHAAAIAPSPMAQQRLARQRVWNLFRIAVLFGVMLPMFAFKVYMDFR